MTDLEKAENKIAKLERKIARLEKRLLDKQKYEAEMLVQTGATPGYINKIHKKDAEALSE